jgi:hypothetical protein
MTRVGGAPAVVHGVCNMQWDMCGNVARPLCPVTPRQQAIKRSTGRTGLGMAAARFSTGWHKSQPNLNLIITWPPFRKAVSSSRIVCVYQRCHVALNVGGSRARKATSLTVSRGMSVFHSLAKNLPHQPYAIMADVELAYALDEKGEKQRVKCGFRWGSG